MVNFTNCIDSNIDAAQRGPLKCIVVAWLIINMLLCGLASAEFKIPTPGTDLRFPSDHGKHTDYQTEWWYLTAQLGTCNKERSSEAIFETQTDSLGIQLTFFRRARELGAKTVDGFLAHAAVADIPRKKYVHESRSSAVDSSLAGAADGRIDLWNHEWFFRQQGESLVGEMRLDGVGTVRIIAPLPAVWLQGEKGFSKKGDCPSCSSYYYSMPRLQIKAEVIDPNGAATELCGLGWFDHEWMSSALSEAQNGWDWVSLMCKDGRNIMAFTVRGADPFSSWSIGEQKGNSRGQIFIPTKQWQSNKTGAKYPLWTKLTLPDFSAALSPLLEDQEFSSSSEAGISYWEGAVRTDNECLGYLELTGYKEKPKV